MSKRILVVDDEQLLLDLLTHLLSKFGYQVDQAIDSAQAAGKIKEEEYDLIFLDMKMPLMDGRGFYLKIKERFPHFAKRIVFLTGDIANQDTTQFIKGTGNFHLHKPFTIKEVRDLLEEFFKGP